MARKIFGVILIAVSAFFLLGNLALFAPYIGGEYASWQDAAASHGVMLLVIAVDIAVGCGGIRLLRGGKRGKTEQTPPADPPKPKPAPVPAPARDVKLFSLPEKLVRAYYAPDRREKTGTNYFEILLSADGKLIEESTFEPVAFSSLDDDQDWPTPVQKELPFEQLGQLIELSADPKAKEFVGLTAENAADYYDWLIGKREKPAPVSKPDPVPQPEKPTPASGDQQEKPAPIAQSAPQPAPEQKLAESIRAQMRYSYNQTYGSQVDLIREADGFYAAETVQGSSFYKMMAGGRCVCKIPPELVRDFSVKKLNLWLTKEFCGSGVTGKLYPKQSGRKVERFIAGGNAQNRVPAPAPKPTQKPKPAPAPQPKPEPKKEQLMYSGRPSVNPREGVVLHRRPDGSFEAEGFSYVGFWPPGACGSRSYEIPTELVRDFDKEKLNDRIVQHLGDYGNTTCAEAIEAFFKGESV